MSEREKVLYVDDDPDILAAYQRMFRKQFHIETEQVAERALTTLESQGPYAVIVADMRMPGMDGLEFLAHARKATPQSVRIMLTGAGTDPAAIIEAINQGHIFRFLTKPCPPEAMAQALSSAIDQYRSALSERDLLRHTLSGAIKLLNDVLALVKPAALTRAQRVTALAQRLAMEAGASADSQVGIAALLSQLGCLALPDDMVRKVASGVPLAHKELRLFEQHPLVGRDLIANIPRLESVAAIVGYQERRFDGGGMSEDPVRGDAIPFESRVLKLALDYDGRVAGGDSPVEAYREIRHRDGWYDPALVSSLLQLLIADGVYVIRSLGLGEVTSDMMLAEDLRSPEGLVLLMRGTELTPSVRILLRSLMKSHGMWDPLAVLVPTPAVA